MIDSELLKILACPVCKATLAEAGETLQCTRCGLRYPVQNGIPVLLAEEAQRESNAGGKI